MRVNKTIKSLAVALPMFALAACSSNSSTEEQSQVDTNASAENSQMQDTVQVSAAQRAAEIEEQKRQQQMDMLSRENIIYFEFDKSGIDSKFASILDAHAKYLNANPNVNVLIEGHTDERGTPEYNIALGERRAKAVMTYLENMGVAAAQMSVVSYGEEKPVAMERTEAAFAKNRRAVLVY